MTDKLSPDSSERRPLSQYDNLASVSVIGTSPPVKEELMFKDIKFQFDDINHGPRNDTSALNPPQSSSFNKSVISDAKSIFFGLHKPSNNGNTLKDENLPLMSEQESQTPKVTTPVAAKLQNNTADSSMMMGNKESPNHATNAAASSLNSSNGSSNNNGNGSSSKKQITLLVDDNDTSSLGQSYLNSSGSPSQVRMFSLFLCTYGVDK